MDVPKGVCSTCGEKEVDTVCIVCAVDRGLPKQSGIDENKTSCRWCKGQFDEWDLARLRQEMAQEAVRTIAHEAREVKALLENINDAFTVIETKLKRLNNMGAKLAVFVKANEGKR